MQTDRLETFALKLFAGLFQSLPRTLALRLGAGLGQLASHLVRRPAATARDNLAMALPELSGAEREKLAKSCFRHLGMTVAELLQSEKSLQRDLDHLSLEGIEHLRQAVQLQRGVILFSAHLGFWEAGSLLAHYDLPISIIAKPMHNPGADRMLNRLRTLSGGEVINSMGGGRKIIQALRSRRVVAILLDQHYADEDRVSVPFFGRPAWTSSAVIRMALKTGAPLVPCKAIRQPDNRSRVTFYPPLEVPTEVNDATVLATATAVTETIEAMVRENPEQWFWVHRRWRE